jgi:enamine deaminase RidA (YjgF/YER057c/UK114 family)
VNLKREDLAALREVRSAYLPAQDPPASTVVGVSALANPDCLVEIEVTAVLR